MPVFEIESGGKVFEVEAPDQAAALAAVSQQPPQGFAANAMDFLKSIPRGMVTGFTSLPNPNPALMEDERSAEMQGRAAAADTVKAPLHAPAGRAGRFGEAIGEGLGNPLSYAGPGSAALKIGGALMSSAGGEAAAQGAEGTVLEQPARIAGALAGGVAAGKSLGPRPPKAAVPTADELFSAGKAGYQTARNSGLELSPQGVSSWAAKTQQELVGPDHGFTGGLQGTAPKTFGVLDTLQNAPDGAIVTASNIDTIRRNLQHIASETQPAQGGFAKPTPDAAAASAALRRLNEYSESVPSGHVLAGSAEDYVRATREANANWGAGSRVKDFDTRLTKAENATDRQVAGSLDSQIKIKAGQLLDNPQKTRGLNDAELEQLQLVNSGDWKSNMLRQLGRGGAGVIPIAGQLAAAGPVFSVAGLPGLAAQGALAAGLYGARKGSEAMTKSRAKDLAEMLAKRSPEYERRAAALPSPDNSPQKMAIIRALLGAD